ncbi:MAG: hypothetical protein JXD18_11970 [Anaerolineae bacterium]|nr:hypothetical protein [Anaerolineae bacterium]
MSRYEPLFAGLVFNEGGESAESVYVGDEACYAIPEEDFLYHVEAIEVDRQIVQRLKERFLAMKDTLVDAVMQMTGSDDPFSRAAIVRSLENMEQILEARGAVTEDMRLGLWMTGFRVIVNFRGEVVHVEVPGLDGTEE